MFNWLSFIISLSCLLSRILGLLVFEVFWYQFTFLLNLTFFWYSWFVCLTSELKLVTGMPSSSSLPRRGWSLSRISTAPYRSRASVGFIRLFMASTYAKRSKSFMATPTLWRSGFATLSSELNCSSSSLDKAECTLPCLTICLAYFSQNISWAEVKSPFRAILQNFYSSRNLAMSILMRNLRWPCLIYLIVLPPRQVKTRQIEASSMRCRDPISCLTWVLTLLSSSPRGSCFGVK